ncbi:MAG: hypothetical protein DMG38_15240 [Acidobacteria bacterium]|nr:MAG: hypothetical protein DMG38_15240 [Acidobacteriota bacterium]
MVSQRATSAASEENSAIFADGDLVRLRNRRCVAVNGLGIIAVSEGVLAVFIAGTWWWVLRQQDVYVGWRRTASLAGLALPTVALIVELVLEAVVAHYRSLEAGRG